MASSKSRLFKKGKKKLKVISYISNSRLQAFLQKSFSILLIVAGFAVIFSSTSAAMGLDWSNPWLPQQEATQTVRKPDFEPKTLFIPKISRTLNITEGKVEGNRWATSQTGVSYLNLSQVPDLKGNSVVYGHNLPQILGNLYQVGQGDNIYVVMKSGDIAKYEVFETKEVTPQSVEILNPTEDSRLTLYTCSGFLDSARFVVLAKQTKISFNL